MNEKELTQLNDQLSQHMSIIQKYTVVSEKHGRLLLASPPTARYPYIYPRDASCAVQFFRRLATSINGYDVSEPAFDLMKSMAHFMKITFFPLGFWGQRYSVEGENKSIYKQEDNVAHGIAILCNYLLAAHSLRKEVKDLEDFLSCIHQALDYRLKNFYQKE